MLEERLERKFLHLACRHHIAELLLRGVVEAYWKGTTGPHVPIFLRFQKDWNKIDQSNYKTGMNDELTVQILREKRDDLLLFITNEFQVYKLDLFLMMIRCNQMKELSFLMTSFVCSAS